MPKTRLHSSLRFTTFREIDGVSFWDLKDYPEVPLQEGDLLHVVTDYDRIDRLAYKYYGAAILWPVLAVANDVELVSGALVPGTRLRIPSPRFVREVLFTPPRVKF